MDKIDRFREEYFFLSNFYPCKIVLFSADPTKNIVFTNAEACFQSYKLESFEERRIFEGISGGEAKKLGRQVKLRNDWEEIKDDVMAYVLTQKFYQNPDLKEKLLATGDAELIEGNTWHDYYWGVCNGRGQNRLGKILMSLREAMRK